MKVFENRSPGFVSVRIEHTIDTELEAEQLMHAVKTQLIKQNARRKHDGRPELAYRIEVNG